MKVSPNEVLIEDSIKIPSRVYDLQITQCKVTTSNKGNLMVVTSAIIVAPDTVTVRTESGLEHVVPVAMRKVDPWYNVLDPTKEYGLGRVVQALKRANLYELVLDSDGNVDTDKFENLVGRTVKALVTCEQRYLEYEDENGVRRPVVDQNGNPLHSGVSLKTDWSKVSMPGVEINMPVNF